ncbi:hypothetical protein EDC94DRAFT_695560 [Helicostylum pulchrum]|nr:hypothetical protein EDC94DRAFT_695560 [Helicostylum pulchrum]
MKIRYTYRLKQNSFTEILPASQRLDDLLVELDANINYQEGQLEYVQQIIAQDNLSLHLHLVLLDLHPQFLGLRTTTACVVEVADTVKNTVEEQLNSRLQITHQIQLSILTSEEALQRMREQEQQNQDFLNQNERAQEYIQNTQLLLQMKNLQIVDSSFQQIVLALRNPEYKFIFQSITDETFWSHVYRKVFGRP